MLNYDSDIINLDQNSSLHVNQCELFDYLYMNHTATFFMGGPLDVGASSFEYWQISANAFHVRWYAEDFGLTEWDVDIRNRIMDNSSGVLTMGDGNHDPTWIFSNVSLGDFVSIANDGMGDRIFNVTGELNYNLPGHGNVDIWVLEELTNPASVLWYEKVTGLLINGTFDWGGFGWHRFDFVDTNSAFQPNNFNPTLTLGTVSPLSGTQVTQFNFSVVYTDQDNNTPFYVNVLINNTPFSMGQQNPSDTNYIDGCAYQYLTYLQPGTYNYSFTSKDGKFTNNTGTYFGITVSNVSNSNGPQLADGQVSPGIGYNSSTVFTFRVNYSDQDNNPPAYVNITINSTTHSMNQVIPEDMNYIDGCWFQYSAPLDTLGTNAYLFNCSDGAFNASLGPYFAPLVIRTQLFDNLWINHSVVSSWGVNITNGQLVYSHTGGRNFHADWTVSGSWDVDVADRVIYNSSSWFWDGHDPIWIFNQVSLGTSVPIAAAWESEHIFNITGEVDYLLPGYGPVEVWILEDLSTPGGVAWYEKSTGILLNCTTYVWGGLDSYSFDFLGSNAPFTYIPNDYAPELTSGSVYPLNGSETTQFNFSVIYTDLDNNYPLYMNVLINGSPYTMDKQVPSDNNYTDGCAYQYLGYLQPGLYNYSFECGDWNYTNSTPTYMGINVTGYNLNSCTLSNGQVIPNKGYNDTTVFHFQVNYTDIDNNAPTFVNITINMTTYGMVQLNPLDTNYADGCIYDYATTLDTLGFYTFYMNCSDGLYNASTSSHIGPEVIRTQLFDGMNINHTLTSSFFGNGPSEFLYSGGSNGIFSVSWTFGFTTWDVDVRNRIMTNTLGWFIDGDHTPAWIFSITSLGDNIPIGIIQMGPPEPEHTFNVSGEMDYILPGYGPVEVWILTDLTSPAAVWYEKSTGILLNGTFYFFGGTETYTFDFVDTNADITYITNDYAPELTSGSVEPMTGNQTTQFNFTVIYTDQDNNYPLYINTLINGTPFPMQKHDLLDSNYTDGCLYEYLSFLQPGSYNYSFECGDWNYTNSTPTQVGISVVEFNLIQPVLSNGQVIPTTGYNGTTIFVFSVNYTDAENNGPSYINVTINSTSYSMDKQNPLDTNFIDGCIYEYNTQLSDNGVYVFYFNCSDGIFPASDGPYIGPAVKKSPLFDGMFTNYTITSNVMGNGISTFFYSQKLNNDFNVTWTFPLHTWDVSFENRILSNIVGGWLSDGDHTLEWIYPDISLGSFIWIGTVWEGDHLFNVSGELEYFIPGYGPVGVWVLTDISSPGSLWFEKSTGILLNGTVTIFGGGSYYTFNFINTNTEFSYVPWPPTLTSGSVYPLTGDQATLFNFSVTYSDFENATPTFVNVLINGTPYPMQPQNPLDTDYTDGCVYEYLTYLLEGTYNYSFECSDGQFNTSTITYTGLNVSLDLTLPTGNISYPLTNSIQTGNSIAIGGFANGTNSPIQNITINSPAYTLTTSPIGLLEGSYEFTNNTPVANGDTTLEVNITDSGSNSIILNVTFTIDNAPPSISVTNPATNGAIFSGASILVEGLANGTFTNITIFQFNNTNFNLNIDPTNQSAGNFQLENNTALEGFVVIEISVTDNASLTTTVVVWFYVDDKPPTGNISYPIGTSAVQSGSSIIVAGFADGTGSPIQNVTINSSAYTLSINPIGQLAGSYEFTNNTPIANGITTLEINITDSINNSTLLIVTFTVDNVPPNLTVTNPLMNGITVNNATILIEGLVDGTFTNITLFQFNNSNFNLNLDPTNQSAGNFQLENNTALEGYVIIEISVTDNASLTTTVVVWFYVDYKPPTGNISYPIGTSAVQSGSSIIVAGFADGTGSPIQNVTINSSAYTLSINPIGQLAGTYQFTNNTPIANGITTLEINVTDTINTSILLTVTFTVDNSLPSLAFTNPTTNGTILSVASILVEGTADGTFTNITLFQFNNSNFNINIDPTNQSAGSFQLENNTALEGLIIIEISVTDNASLTSTFIIWFYVDAGRPSGSITYPSGNYSLQSGNSISVAGVADGGGIPIQNITINSSVFSLSISPIGLISGAFQFLNNTDIPNGLISLEINITDITNDSVLLTIIFMVDNLPPIVIINSPSNGIALAINTINVTGTANGTLSNIVSIQINDSRFSINPLIDPTNSSFGAFSFTNISNIQGPITLQITVWDNASLSGVGIVLFYVDGVDPYVVSSNIPQGGAIGGQTLQIIGIANGTGSLITNLTINETRFTLQLNPNGTLMGQFIFENNTYLADGIYSIQIMIKDMVNRTSALILTFYIDNTAPPQVLAFNHTKDGRSVTLTWNAVSDLTNITYLIFRNGINIANTTGTSYYDPNLSPGTYNYSIIAIDAAGNAGPISSQMVVIEGEDDFLFEILLILLAVVGSVVAVSVIMRSRRKRRRPSARPESTLLLAALPGKKAGAAEVEIEVEKAIEKAKEPAAEIEKAPEEKRQEKKEIEGQVPKEETPKQFLWRCEQCSNYFTTEIEGAFSCPTCEVQLQFVKQELPDAPKSIYYCLCPNCQVKYQYHIKGIIPCPKCRTPLQFLEEEKSLPAKDE